MTKIHIESPDRVRFWCPGCNEDHTVTVGGTDTWQWNGSITSPTFRPSVKVTTGHFVPSFKPGDRCWCTYRTEYPDEDVTFHCHLCHSFVTEGKIQFLSDSTHTLAGNTVELPEYPAYEEVGESGPIPQADGCAE